jgi:sRNA-binding regulator protein Hfq
MTESSTFCTHAPYSPTTKKEKKKLNIYYYNGKYLQQKKRERHRKKKHYPNGVVGSNVVLINGFKPTNIIMGVRNQVNVYFVRDDSVCCVVVYIL